MTGMFSAIGALFASVGWLGAITVVSIVRKVLWIVAAIVASAASGYLAHGVGSQFIEELGPALDAPSEPRGGLLGLIDRARDRVSDPDPAAMLAELRADWLMEVFSAGVVVGFLCMLALGFVLASIASRRPLHLAGIAAGACAVVAGIVLASGGFVPGNAYAPAVLSPLPAMAGSLGAWLIIEMSGYLMGSSAGGASRNGDQSGGACEVPSEGPDFDLDLDLAP